MRDTEREAETQAEGEAGSLWGPRCGTHPSTPVSVSRPEPKADAQWLSHPGTPMFTFLIVFLQIIQKDSSVCNNSFLFSFYY